MRRTVNLRLVFWTLVSLLVLATLVHLVHSHQMQRNAGALFRQAERALAQKDYAKAAALLQNYLDFEPDDTDAISLLATALEKSSSSAQARYKTYLLLEQVLRRQPDRHDVRRKAVQLAIDLGRFDDAVAHLEYLLSDPADRAGVYYQLGWCQAGLDQNEAAAVSLRKAIALAPERADSYALLAEVLQTRLDQPDEAAQVMDALVAANPQSWKAYLERARFHYGRGDRDATAADIRRACDLAPEQEDVLLAAADLALLQGDLAEARTYVSRGLKLHPKNERLYRMLATLETRAGHPDEAVACLRAGIKALPESAALRVQLAEVLLDQGQTEEPKALLRWLQDQGAPAGVVEYVRGRRLLAAGRWADAAETLLGARTKLASPSEWGSNLAASLGRCHELLGEPDLQLAALRSAVAQDPANAAARLELAKLLLLARLTDEAMAQAETLARLKDVPPQTWVVLGQALVQRLQRQSPSGPVLAELERVIGRASKALPDAAEVVCLRAEVLALGGEADGAVQLLSKELAARPGDAPLWIALADHQARLGKSADAAATLEKAQQRLGPRLELLQARLRFCLTRPGEEGRRGLAVLPLVPAVDADKIRWSRELAAAQLTLGDNKGAAATLRQLASWLPKDLRSRTALFDLLLAARHDADARQVVAELKGIEGDNGVLWRAGEVAVLLQTARRGDQAQLDRARQRLAEIHKLRPEWGRAALLEAYLEELKGDTDKAMVCFRRAFDLGERPPAVVLRVARWLHEHHCAAEADQALRQLEEVGPLWPEAARLAAEVALARGQSKRAADLAARAVPADTRDYRQQLWLARVQWAAGNPLDAEATLRRAVEGAPGVPDVWVALIRYLAHTKQPLQIEATLEQMKQRTPADRLARTLARCYEAAGQWDKAEQTYARAAVDAPEDFVLLRDQADFHCRAEDFARAEPLLRKIVDPATGAPSDITAWARRQWAIGLAQRGGAGDFDLALKLLADNRTSTGGPTVTDERVRAFVLSTNPARRQEAVALFEQTRATRPMTPDEQFLLAHTYEANQQSNSALAEMQSLMLLHGDNARYVAQLARMLLTRGELETAGLHLDTLQRLEPLSPRTQALAAAYWKAKNSTSPLP
jgi:tetratricopeptide (TPR) repeat protein